MPSYEPTPEHVEMVARWLYNDMFGDWDEAPDQPDRALLRHRAKVFLREVGPTLTADARRLGEDEGSISVYMRLYDKAQRNGYDAGWRAGEKLMLDKVREAVCGLGHLYKSDYERTMAALDKLDPSEGAET